MSSEHNKWGKPRHKNVITFRFCRHWQMPTISCQRAYCPLSLPKIIILVTTTLVSFAHPADIPIFLARLSKDCLQWMHFLRPVYTDVGSVGGWQTGHSVYIMHRRAAWQTLFQQVICVLYLPTDSTALLLHRIIIADTNSWELHNCLVVNANALIQCSVYWLEPVSIVFHPLVTSVSHAW